MSIIVIFVVCALIFGLPSGVITNGKGRGFAEGMLWGTMLGFIGLIVAACLPANHTKEG